MKFKENSLGDTDVENKKRRDIRTTTPATHTPPILYRRYKNKDMNFIECEHVCNVHDENLFFRVCK